MNKCFPIVIVLLANTSLTFTNTTVDRSFQKINQFGYVDRGDSIEFVFGQEKMITIGGLKFLLDKRRAEIKKVNLAGDFNGWDANNASFVLKKVDSKLFKIVLSKQRIGKMGELRQFKFVLNGKYWIEPPDEAVNKITGKDGNTNLSLQL